MDKIEKSLTPKQAVILWLQSTMHIGNVLEYVQFLQNQPESEAPIYNITKKVSQSSGNQ